MTTMRVGALLLAALVGGALVLLGQQFAVTDAPPPSPDAQATAAPQTQAQPDPAFVRVVNDPRAERIIRQTLDAAGVHTSSIQRGQYPVMAEGQRSGKTMPLISLTCPQSHPCSRIFAAIKQSLAEIQLDLLQSSRGDRPGRAMHRAVAANGRPVLVIRAYPPGPRLSVVVDDVGVEPGLLDRLLKLDEDVTFAVSADARHAAAVAGRLHASGREVIAHLPLEPLEGHQEGQEFLHLGMNADSIRDKAREFLDRVPGVSGADGHLGGKFTQSREHVRALMSVLAKRGHYFLDQRAAESSVATSTAQALGVRTVARTHRIDGDESVDAKLKAVEVALVLEGSAVIAVSPSPQILSALGPWLDGLRKRKIQIMRLSEVVL